MQKLLYNRYHYSEILLAWLFKAALIHKQWEHAAKLYSESKEDGFRVLK